MNDVVDIVGALAMFVCSCIWDSSGLITKYTPEVINVSTPAIVMQDTYAETYTCNGDGISPEVAWENVPKDAKSLIVMVEAIREEARDTTHWLMYDVPVTAKSLPAGLPTKDKVVPGKQAQNDFGVVGYRPPCPKGKEFEYRLSVFALDIPSINVPPGKDTDTIIRGAQGHVIAYGNRIGRYGRDTSADAGNVGAPTAQ